MNTNAQPVIVRSMTKSLRINQGITIATTLLISLGGLSGGLGESGSTQDIEASRFVGWLFLVVALLQVLVVFSYDLFFLVDGQKQCVVRVRRWWNWQWSRIYPGQDFSEVQTYQINGSQIAGHYLQLVGNKKRLRLVYCPSGKGLEELAQRIAEQLQLPYYREGD